jgi:hypothetical protein
MLLRRRGTGGRRYSTPSQAAGVAWEQAGGWCLVPEPPFVLHPRACVEGGRERQWKANADVGSRVVRQVASEVVRGATSLVPKANVGTLARVPLTGEPLP